MTRKPLAFCPFCDSKRYPQWHTDTVSTNSNDENLFNMTCECTKCGAVYEVCMKVYAFSVLEHETV